MDFKHNEERRMLEDTITRFLEKDYPMSRRNEAAGSDLGYDQRAWAQMAELGVFMALFDEAHGGFGGEGFDFALVFEAMGRALFVGPVVESIVLAGGALAASSNDAHGVYLEEMLSGGARATFAHFEDQGRYDIAHVATKAVQSGDSWILDGTKSVVAFCEGADSIVVSARVDGNVNDAEGLALFLVPKNTKGVDLRSYALLDGGSASELTLNDVTLPGGSLIGEAGKAFAILEEIIGKATLAVSSEALGIMEVIKTMTIEYLQTRKQFGVAIGRFQALQHRIAEVLLEIVQARSAVINAAADLGKTRNIREQTLSATKYSMGRIGRLVAEESIQLHGGIGMTWEYDLGHYAKRLVMIDHEYGDEDYHLQRFIAFGRG